MQQLMLLIIFLSLISSNKPKTNDVPLQTPEAIPLSIGLGQMTQTSDITCTSNTCPSGSNLQEGSYDLNSPTFYRCGSICSTSTGTFGYEFKGVKFGIVGTKTPDHHSFIIEIDGKNTEVSTYKTTREEYSLLYVSEDLKYDTHKINIKANGELIELYKLVYWPSLIAKRLNSSEFEERVGKWNTESDGVGGIRQYAFSDGTTDSIKTTRSYSKVWIYGSKCSWCEPFEVTLGDFQTRLELHQQEEGRTDMILLYESDEYINDNYIIQFLSSGDSTLNCIYYIDVPVPTASPTPKAIPLSIGLDYMTKSNDIICSSNSCPSGDNLPEGSYDINSPDFYRCGIICNTSTGTFNYEFKGVKFGLVGTSSPTMYSFLIEVDGQPITVNTHKATNNEYSLLYVSADLEYKTHTINIKGQGKLYELYKLVFWPSLYARRLNATDFDTHVGTWKIQSDNVGGLRQYATQDSTKDSVTSRIWTSQIWFYGTKCSWCEPFDLTIGDAVQKRLELNQAGRTDTTLLFETEVQLNYYNVTLESSGDSTLNCIYYIYEPGPPPGPTPEAIPLSIGLGQMTQTSDILCSSNTCPDSDNLQEGSYDLNSPTFYRCGSICNTSTGTFGYEFKGVKFGIVGTKTPDHHSFIIEIDGKNTEVSTYKTTREEYSLLYVSEDLKYDTHKINIKGKGETFELYKLVYWPSLIAKRLNSSEFEERVGTWNTQSDGVGGIRQYAFSDGTTDSIKTTRSYSKVWIYGSKCSWCEPFEVTLGDFQARLELHQQQEGRTDMILLYESDEYINDNYIIQFLSSGDSTLNCIYYIDVPVPTASPTPKAIPLSIGLDYMTKSNDIICSSNSCPSGDNLPEGSYDINSPDFYRCGIICNTSTGTFNYEFKGVKFGLVGTSSPTMYSFLIEVDGQPITVNTHKASRNEYSLLYVSDDLEYKTHTINIKGQGKLYELYKIVYWPSLVAKRLNTTDFDTHVGTWKIQSDGVGGLRQYATQDGTTDSISSTIVTNYIWFYGTRCSWCEYFDLTVGDVINTRLELNQQEIKYTGLLYETNEINPNIYNVKLEASGDATLNCIYYVEVPIPSEELIKNEEDCDNNKRCKHEEKEDKPVNVYINVTTFSNLKETVDGNAIYIINAGLRCNKSSFTNCGSGNNAGGAIYLKNELDYESNAIVLEHLTFKDCQAKYGGAVYIYSSSNLNVVTILGCQFIGNKATGEKNDDNNYGGSAVYLTVCDGLLQDNTFSSNKGKGGAIKIVDIFEKNKKDATILNNEHVSLIISKCLFDINSDSDCSLFYISGKYGSLVELKDSVFTGKLSSKSNYIKGMIIDKDAPKLVVKNCKFDSNSKKSFNNDDFLIIDLNNQIFNDDGNDYIKKKKTKLMSDDIMITASILVPALALVVFVLAMIIKMNNNANSGEIDSIDESIEPSSSMENKVIFVDQSI